MKDGFELCRPDLVGGFFVEKVFVVRLLKLIFAALENKRHSEAFKSLSEEGPFV